MAKKNRLETLMERQEARKTLLAQSEPPLFLELYKKMISEGLNEVCQCSRIYIFNSIPHCPNCGTSNVYAYASANSIRKLPNDQQCKARGYRCRRCTLPFTDVDTFLHCEAQAPLESIKEVRLKEKADTALQRAGFEGIEDFREKVLALGERNKRKSNGDK